MNVIVFLWLIASASVLFSGGLVFAKQRGFLNWIDWSWLLAFVVIILLIGILALSLAEADEWP